MVAVVGATFAYFTATSSSQNSENTATTVNTAKVGNQSLNYTGGKSESKINYPGGAMVVGGKVVASVEGDATVDFGYKIKFSISAGLLNEHSTLEYTLYELTSEQTSLLDETCKLVSGTEESNTTYYYENCDATQTIKGGTVKKTGTLTQTQLASEGNELLSEELSIPGVTSSMQEEQRTKYYYLVVKYPNYEGSQNEDFEKEITVQVTGVDEATYKVAQN